MLVCLDGWVDAGRVLARLEDAVLGAASVRVASFDPDQLFTYRSRRPTMHVDDGINTGVSMPGVELLACRDLDGRDTLVLSGQEPDLAWSGFSDAVVQLAQAFGVRMLLGAGAYPAATPHTRDVVLSAVGTTPKLVETVGYLEGKLSVPAGIHGAIERACAKAGIPAVGLWAPVPHYVADASFPAAVTSILDAVQAVADRRFLTPSLQAEADASLDRLDALHNTDPDRRNVVSSLESRADNAPGSHPSELPSGDQLAAEFTQFLEDNSDGGL